MFICFVLAGCTENTPTVHAILIDDTKPPVLLAVESVDEKTVKLVFDKQVEPFKNSFSPFEAVSEGYGIIVTLNETLKAGESIELEGRVTDSVGNTTGIRTPVWGYNPRIPQMLINEITTKDSPRTEIKFLSSGNICGAVLYDGVPDSNDNKVILPDVDVKSGDFAVIWWAQSVSEPAITSGNFVKDGSVIDICSGTKTHPSSNNGVQTLSVSPAQGASVVDCIVYSNRSSAYDGYGTSLARERAQVAVDNLWWSSISDPALSIYSTKTRSISRRPKAEDTDSANDWFITITGGSSFGSENTEAIYSPDD